MKTFVFSLLLVSVAAIAVAWNINYQRYGYRRSLMGPFEVGGEVTAANLLEHVNIRSDEPLPKAEVIGEATHDFGVMAPNTEGEHVFIVKNSGEATLNLRLGATTCKCTLGELDKSDLEPGEQTEIKLSWKVKPGTSEFGESAEVLTNDPGNIAIQLKVVGKVVESFELVPDTWTFADSATGDTINISGAIYNFMDQRIEPTEMKFSSEDMTRLAEFEVEALEPSENKLAEGATQAFRIVTTIQPGLRQGSISQDFLFGFRYLDDQGNPVTSEDDDSPKDLYIKIPTKGRIVGNLRMIESSRLKAESGGYLYDFGKLTRDDSLRAKTFVVLKGSERDNTTLRVGKTSPKDVVRASLGEPKGRGTMDLYPLEIELIPGDKPIERLGKDSGDYGSIWIESDNPKVSKMRIVLKFAIEGR